MQPSIVELVDHYFYTHLPQMPKGMKQDLLRLIKQKETEYVKQIEALKTGSPSDGDLLKEFERLTQVGDDGPNYEADLELDENGEIKLEEAPWKK